MFLKEYFGWIMTRFALLAFWVNKSGSLGSWEEHSAKPDSKLVSPRVGLSDFIQLCQTIKDSVCFTFQLINSQLFTQNVSEHFIENTLVLSTVPTGGRSSLQVEILLVCLSFCQSSLQHFQYRPLFLLSRIHNSSSPLSQKSGLWCHWLLLIFY